jgi:hypothetical protein
MRREYSSARLRSTCFGSPYDLCSPHISLGSAENSRTSFWSHVWLIPNCRAQSRPDGLLWSRQVSHWNTNRRIISDSSRLRQGRGGWYLELARAFARFRTEASYGSLRDSGLYNDAICSFPLPRSWPVATHLCSVLKDLAAPYKIAGKLFRLKPSHIATCGSFWQCLHQALPFWCRFELPQLRRNSLRVCLSLYRVPSGLK